MMRAGWRHALHAFFGLSALSGVARAESSEAPSAQRLPAVVESPAPSAVASRLPSTDEIATTSEPRAQSQGPAEPSATPDNRGTGADSGDNEDLAPSRY